MGKKKAGRKDHARAESQYLLALADIYGLLLICIWCRNRNDTLT